MDYRAAHEVSTAGCGKNAGFTGEIDPPPEHYPRSSPANCANVGLFYPVARLSGALIMLLNAGRPKQKVTIEMKLLC